jgi:UDP-glucose 4-epimerase
VQSILVTGGSGFIGRHLVSRLLQNNRVVIIDNLSSGKVDNVPMHQNVVFYKEDVRNQETIADIIKRERIDACIHLAAKTNVADSIVNPTETIEVNVNGTLSVLEACARNEVRTVVFASSAAVYGQPRELPIPEDHRLEPISPYGASKVSCEALMSSYHGCGKIKNAISLRFFNIYGEDQNSDYAGVITKFADRLSKGLPPIIYGDGMQTRDFVSVNDIVEIAILAMQSNTSGAFNVGTGIAITITELAQLMIGIFGLNLETQYQKAIPGDIIHSCADIKRSTNMGFVARRALKLELKSLIEKRWTQKSSGI